MNAKPFIELKANNRPLDLKNVTEESNRLKISERFHYVPTIFIKFVLTNIFIDE